jgi:hypothetical protein
MVGGGAGGGGMCIGASKGDTVVFEVAGKSLAGERFEYEPRFVLSKLAAHSNTMSATMPSPRRNAGNPTRSATRIAPSRKCVMAAPSGALGLSVQFGFAIPVAVRVRG